jgi:SnoaL-like domain
VGLARNSESRGLASLGLDRELIGGKLVHTDDRADGDLDVLLVATEDDPLVRDGEVAEVGNRPCLVALPAAEGLADSVAHSSEDADRDESGEDPPEFAQGEGFEDTDSTMSQRNVAVARRWVELFNERSDVDEFLSLHDPEVELQTPGGPRLRGHDQVREWFDAGFENVQSRIIPERFVAEGDIVVGLGRIVVRWIESGEVAHDGESAGAFWFRDGRIIAWQPFETHAAALKETGLEG